MRIKHGLPLSPLSSGRKGSGAARERLGDEHEWGDRGGQGVTVALLAVGTCHARPLGAAELAAHGSLVSLNKGGKARKAAKEGEARRGERGSEAMSRGGRPPVPAWPWLFPRAHRKATTLVTQGLQRCSVRGASSVEKDGAVYVIYSEIS